MVVSILIPCYNAERWVAQAIESALAQTWPLKEILVVDDGSTDRSLAIIKSFGSRIRWETGPNKGGNVARNRLLEMSAGTWLQFLDADDYLIADKIERQMRFVSANPQTDVVFGRSVFEVHSENATHREVLEIPHPHDPWVLLARWYLPQTGSPLWRRDAVVEVGGWKFDQPCCQEHELYLRLLIAGKSFAYCAETGSVYRQWSEQTVCKRNKPKVYRHRLEIEQKAEAFLRSQNQLSPMRLSAINQARFEIARLAWQYDRSFAKQIIQVIAQSQSGFVPCGAAAGRLYMIAYRIGGFRFAEMVADCCRPFRKAIDR